MDQDHRLTGAMILVVQLDPGRVLLPDSEIWHCILPDLRVSLPVAWGWGRWTAAEVPGPVEFPTSLVFPGPQPVKGVHDQEVVRDASDAPTELNIEGERSNALRSGASPAMAHAAFTP